MPLAILIFYGIDFCSGEAKSLYGLIFLVKVMILLERRQQQQ